MTQHPLGTAIMAHDQLIKAIKAHIERGDKAKEKAEQHYIAAGQHLKELKATAGNWREWEELLKQKIGIGKSRASELMQIASGKKTVEQVRERSNETAKAAQAKKRQSSPLISGENDTHSDSTALVVPPAKKSTPVIDIADVSIDTGLAPEVMAALQIVQKMSDEARELLRRA